jgi:cyclopropane fatty-acyl-phospholipid synthase-like methyltransferase
MPYSDIVPYYANLSRSERFYARFRYLTAPLERVAALVPPSASSLVELGCSAGVFANIVKVSRPEMDVTGVDVDARKIAVAAKTVRGRRGISFVAADAFGWLESQRPADVIAVVDVLYLFKPELQDEFIRRTVDLLQTGGTLIIKEMTDRPAWKRRWCAFQEWLAVRVVGITKGSGIYLRPGDDYRRTMEMAGLAVESFNLSRGYLHPHAAWRGTKK